MALHRKKRFTSFPSPAGMSLTKHALGRNYSVMTSLFPPRESLVVTSRLGTGNSRTFFLRCRSLLSVAVQLSYEINNIFEVLNNILWSWPSPFKANIRDCKNYEKCESNICMHDVLLALYNSFAVLNLLTVFMLFNFSLSGWLRESSICTLLSRY